MKNKYQEALDYFLDREEGDNVTVTCDWLFYAEELKELVNKATPEKPTFNGHVYFCGKCHGSVWQIKPESNYCFRCGQKLDWSKI